MNKEQLLAALEAALRSGNQTQLEEYGKQAVENFPTDSFGYAYLAEAFLLLDSPKYPQAETLLAKAIELEDNNIDYRLRFAVVKEMQGMFDDAAILYQQVLGKNDSNFHALKGMGICELYGSQNNEEALAYFDKALALTDDAETHALKSDAHSNLQQYPEALAAANNGLKKGFNESAAVAKITALELNNQSDGVEELYKKLTGLHPEDFALHFNYGKFLLEQHRAAESETQLLKALSIMDDGNPILRNMLADALFAQGKFKEAIQRYDECLELDKEDPYLYAYRSDAKLGLGDVDGALKDLNSAIKQLGDDAIATAPILVKKAFLYQEKGDIPKAKEILKPICENPQTRAFGCYGIGVVLFKADNMEHSYTMLKVAKQLKYKPAIDFINNNLSDYLNGKRQEILDGHAADISNNAKSNLLNKLSGKLWTFKDLQSKKMEAYDNALQTKIKDTLKVVSVVFTEKGLVFMNDGEGELLTYKINNESDNTAKVEFRALDSNRTFGGNLKLDNGLFSFSKEDNEWIILQEQDLKAIPSNIKENFKENLTKEEVNSLGKNIDSILKAIY